MEAGTQPKLKTKTDNNSPELTPGNTAHNRVENHKSTDLTNLEPSQLPDADADSRGD